MGSSGWERVQQVVAKAIEYRNSSGTQRKRELVARRELFEAVDLLLSEQAREAAE